MIGDYVGLEMRCVGAECDRCKGTGRLPPAVSADNETAAMHRAQALQNTDCPAPLLTEQASEAAKRFKKCACLCGCSRLFMGNSTVCSKCRSECAPTPAIATEGEARARKVKNELLDNDDNRTSRLHIDSDNANSNSAGYFEKDVACPKPPVEKDAMQVLDEDERQALAYIRTFPGFAQAKDEEIKREFSQWLLFRSERNAAVRELLAYKSASPNPHEGERSGWPKWVDMAERYEDMTPTGCLRMIRQQDGDVILVAIGEDFQQVALEFCIPMTGGGGSEHTHKALCALMVAMEKDNSEKEQNRQPRTDVEPVAHSADAGGAEQK